MAGIWITRNELITTMSEIIGYKSGIALNEMQMLKYIDEDSKKYWIGDKNGIIRIRSEVIEIMTSSILHGIGNLSEPLPSSIIPYSLYHKVKHNKELLEQYSYIMDLLLDFFNEGIKKYEVTGDKLLDPRPFIKKAQKKYGGKGAALAIMVLDKFNEGSHASPWSEIRRLEWKDITELNELFKSESLTTNHGSFIDQRFIDYLYANFQDIDNMNWRKFEGLTCEFFERSGYHVEIGKGRDDGGIDARIWTDNKTNGGPPLIIVQCKREKEKVGRTVVKALWADLIHENAKSGLIVTTNSLSPGAIKDCIARGYPINEANRKTLYQWLDNMKSPYTGVFMGE